MNSQDYRNIVKTFTDKDYQLVHKFYRIEDCCGSVQLALSLPALSDPVKALKNTQTGKIYFSSKEMNIIPFNMAIQNNDSSFDLYELTYEAYCKYGF